MDDICLLILQLVQEFVHIKKSQEANRRTNDNMDYMCLLTSQFVQDFAILQKHLSQAANTDTTLTNDDMDRIRLLIFEDNKPLHLLQDK